MNLSIQQTTNSQLVLYFVNKSTSSIYIYIYFSMVGNRYRYPKIQHWYLLEFISDDLCLTYYFLFLQTKIS